MSKQDGYSSRTAADLERKYNFGKTFAEVYGLVRDAQRTAEEAKNAYEGLDQEQIFNLLTNFGKSQGIYRDDTGNVYVNASYIKSGKLAAEYIDAENLKVSAANITGELVATQIDTKDLKVLAANITGTLTAGQIDTTNLKVSAANVTGTLSASQIDATNLKVAAANITGTLTASQIDASSLKVSSANITGTLTFSQLPSTVAETSDIPTSTSQLTNNSGYVTSSTVTTITNNAISTAYISASRITSGTLDADNIVLGGSYGGFSLARGVSVDASGNTSTTYGAKVYGSSPSTTYLIVTDSGIRLQGYACDFYVADYVIGASEDIQIGSDRRVKQDISYDVEKYRAFLRSLKPSVFHYTAKPDSPMTCGFIAQDVEAALTANGLTRADFSGLGGGAVDAETGELSKYSLAYTQFIPLLTDAVQDLYSQMEKVKQTLGG